MRVPLSEFRRLDLQVHRFLAEVPLLDVSAVDLPGGGPGHSLADVRGLVRPGELFRAGRATRFLFALRLRIGRWLSWDRGIDRLGPESYVHRLTPSQRAASLLPPGTADGAFNLVYALANEGLAEIRNATVHAFLCSALTPWSDGYRLYWAIYVKPVSRWTRLYMLAIEPFRRFIVYPSVLGRIRQAWIAKYGQASASPRTVRPSHL